MQQRFSALNMVFLILGFAFLYLPLMVIVAYSFNGSKLVTVWGGFSTQWYESLWQNEQLLKALALSFKIATASATLATILGTLAAWSLVRGGKFLGHRVFGNLIYAPMVLPEVMLGLAFLLLFVGMDWERNATTIILAHTTFAMCFVAVIIKAQLADLDIVLEEAAQDLGATPTQTFLAITLPQIWPGIAAGWMLAFVLSLDDVVISSFVAGPGSTTLPMRLYSQMRLGITPEINAVSTVLIGVATLAVIAGSVMQQRNRKKSNF